jgi:hypothetical protein
LRKFTRWVAAYDSHGDLIDPVTRRAFFEFVKWFKPDVKIAGGDHFDFRWLRGKASEQEKREKTTGDIDAGVQFLGEYQPNTLLLGNHEDRLWKAAQSDCGQLSDFCANIIVDLKQAIPNARIVPYCKRRGYTTIGRLKFIHGYHCGLNAVKQAATVYGNVCMGHIHASDFVSIPRHERCVGHSSGCLAKIDLEYNKTQANTLRQNNGWLYGTTSPGGSFTVWHADKQDGAFILPSEFRETR